MGNYKVSGVDSTNTRIDNFRLQMVKAFSGKKGHRQNQFCKATATDVCGGNLGRYSNGLRRLSVHLGNKCKNQMRLKQLRLTSTKSAMKRMSSGDDESHGCGRRSRCVLRSRSPRHCPLLFPPPCVGWGVGLSSWGWGGVTSSSFCLSSS